jgi:phosphoribosylamine--glycine ligase
MRVLLIDPTASFLDFAMRAEAQGHEVRWFLGPDKLNAGGRYTVGDGLVQKVADFRPHMKWADLILNSDNCKYTHELEGYRNAGYPLFAPNLECTRWELDRMYGQQVLADAGIDVLEAIEFKNYDEAIAHQLANLDTRYVSKPCADVDKALSYVSKGACDMLFMLEHWKAHQKKKVPFIFQPFFPGIEMAVGGWVGRDGFSSWFLENFEFKKLMNDDLGVNTGEQGTVMRYVQDSELARRVLLPLEAALIRAGYTGYVDVAVMINDKGEICPLEFTTRHGWPLFQIQQALHPDICNWMADLLEGRDTFKPYTDVAVGVVVTMPEFPYSHMMRKDVTGFPVWGIDASNRFNIHPAEMMLGEGYDEKGKKQPMLVSAGDYLLIASGTGRTVSQAKTRAYKTIKQLEIPNSPMYRTDIGCRLEEQLPKLQKLGFALGWEW